MYSLRSDHLYFYGWIIDDVSCFPEKFPDGRFVFLSFFPLTFACWHKNGREGEKKFVCRSLLPLLFVQLHRYLALIYGINVQRGVAQK